MPCPRPYLQHIKSRANILTRVQSKAYTEPSSFSSLFNLPYSKDIHYFSGEYCNSFDSENTPALRCFLCFQGYHECEQNTSKLSSLPSPLPQGLVWLCTNCTQTNNPIPAKPSKSRGASKSAIKPTSIPPLLVPHQLQ